MNNVYTTNLYQYIMVVLSVLYLLYKTDKLNLKNIINYIVCAVYILFMILLSSSDMVMMVGFKGFILKNLINYGSLMIMALLISQNKSIGVYSALCVLFIFNIFDFLISYYRLWYSSHGYLLYVVIPLITIGLSYMNCLKYNHRTLMNLIIFHVIWACIWFGMIYYTLGNDSSLIISSPLFIIIFSGLFMIWAVINRMFIVKK